MPEILKGDELVAQPDVIDALSTVRALALRLGRGRHTKADEWATEEFSQAATGLLRAADTRVIYFDKITSLAPMIQNDTKAQTARTLVRWEQGWRSSGQPSLLASSDMPIDEFEVADFRRLDVRIMLSAVAQTASYLQSHYHKPSKITPITYFDPASIEEWFARTGENNISYSTLKQLLIDRPQSINEALSEITNRINAFDYANTARDHQMSESQLRSLMPPFVVRGFATHGGDSFSRNISRYLQNISVLTCEMLANERVSDPAIVAIYFGQGEAQWFAVHNPQNPTAAAQRYLDTLLKGDLSLASLARLYNIETDEQVIGRVIPIGHRKELARRYPGSHYKQLITYRECTNRLVGRGLPLAVARKIALHRPQQADKVADELFASLLEKPGSVSRELWFDACIQYRNKPDQRKIYIANRQLYYRVRYPLSLDASYGQSRSLEGRIGDSSVDPAEILFGDSVSPEDELSELARVAGISDEQMSLLISAFSNDDQTTLSTEQKAIIESLRNVAASTID